MSEIRVLGPDPAFRRALEVVRQVPATVVFLAACVALFATAERHGSTLEVETLVRFGATERGRVWAGEPWRLVTAAFLHIGVVHLLWNVINMFGWCVPVERTLGSRRFILLYLGSAMAASGLSLVLHDVVSAGASGAGFGMVGAHLALERRRLPSWSAFGKDPRVRKMLVSLLVWTAVLSMLGVDHAAHLGGFLAGLAITWSLIAPRGAGRPRAVAALTVIIPVVLALIPHGGMTRYEAAMLEREVETALDKDDRETASRALDRAEQAGLHSDRLALGRAYLLFVRGDEAGAAQAYAELARSADPETRRLAGSQAKLVLALRLDLGRGMPRDPVRARKLLQEVCSEGNVGVCKLLEAERAPAGGGVSPAAR